MRWAGVLLLVFPLIGSVTCYRNAPIIDPQASFMPNGDPTELETNGVPISRYGTTFKVPRERGYCNDNGLCDQTSAPNYPSCYSAFYFPPNGYNFPNCNAGFDVIDPPSALIGEPVPPTPITTSGSGSNEKTLNTGNFNTYNMSYEARLYLMDLDFNGYGPITNNGTDKMCVDNFSDLCYVVMWIHNIRAGFGCRQNVNRTGVQTFRGSPYFPPCRSFCDNLLLYGCPALPNSILLPGQSVAQFCELAPTINCYNAAPSFHDHITTLFWFVSAFLGLYLVYV